jgi:integrase/recombinase XerC
VERARVQPYADSQALDSAEVKRRLAAIDRDTLTGRRDYALLLVALTTGRRRAELAALRWRDVWLSGQTVRLTWRRCKGGKTLHDTLAPHVATAFRAWLTAFYGEKLAKLSADSPVWVSLATNRHGTKLPAYGKPLAADGITYIVRQRLGTTRVHALRHTFAQTMQQDAGADVRAVQKRLGHRNLNTTQTYLDALESADNPYAASLGAFWTEPADE